MNINRNNYENIFLLYVDGELSAEQRNAVDLFVYQNPDLAVELEMLLQTKLPFEEIIFEEKEILLNPENTGINLSNYQEYFLLYVDNELTDFEKNEVEKFVLQQPDFQDSFTLLKQTQLQKELIIYPDKDTLFRKEEKPVVFLYWRRIAIAAAFTGLGILLWSIIPFEKKEAVVKNNSSIKNNIASTKTEASLNNNVSKDVVASNHQNKIQRQTDIIASTQERKNSLSVPDLNITASTIQNNTVTAINELPKNDVLENTTEPTARNIDIVSINNLNENNASKNTIQPTLYKETVYKELDTDDEDKNAIYIGNMEINKNKLRGLIKKAGHLFNKPKDEDAKTSIAGFPVNRSSR